MKIPRHHEQPDRVLIGCPDHSGSQSLQNIPVVEEKTWSWGAIQNLFSTDYEEIKAVDKIPFDIAPGEPSKQGVVQ